MQAPTLPVRLRSITYLAQDIVALELTPVGMPPLPAFRAGAHVSLDLPNGLVRSFSLCNPQDETHRYVVAVAREARGRGGSRYVHDSLRPGAILKISPPRNNFPLAEDARHSVLIAGGIGITPLWSMVQRLEALGRSWRLQYCARSRASAAFLDELQILAGGRLHCHFDDEQGGSMPDVAAFVAGEPDDTHLYCCGPVPMLEAFERATSTRPRDFVHTEYFASRDEPATGGGFTVVLAKSGKTLAIAPGKTILGAILDAGLEAAYSCRAGSCAVCEVKVLEGIPDHRDLVLSRAEQSENKTMMICVSGSKTTKLVIDV